MDKRENNTENLLRFFKEREKELECLYRIEEIIKDPDASQGDICMGIVEAIPSGWQYPEVCFARIDVGQESYFKPGFDPTAWIQQADIMVQGKQAGTISVYYSRKRPDVHDGPFLREEARLLRTIASRIGEYIHHREIRKKAEQNGVLPAPTDTGEWKVVLNLLRYTDMDLYYNVSERMLNLLCWNGVQEAEELHREISPGADGISGLSREEENQPLRRQTLCLTEEMSLKIFDIASNQFEDDQMTAYLRKWIKDDKLKFLMHIANRNIALPEIISVLRQYRDMDWERLELSLNSKTGVIVSLVRRLMSTQLGYINIAKQCCDIPDFFGFVDRMVYSSESHGRLGGKSAGLFLASMVLRGAAEENSELSGIKVPNSWYLASDIIQGFLKYNHMDEIVEQKYKDINLVRLEYPHVINSFKNGRFPPDIVQGLSMILDDCEGKPLVIRSSSLLEDSLGAAFSGKYKSLFLANQGSKQERLEALMDAISEIYASIFGPDPIEYRAERGLLDFAEEMGILIQEVVGTRVGDYFLPAFAGVAFSRNEFRWSPRIRCEDGLIRMVPGLGTRAVDRVSDDYPVLIAPGQPGLRVNVAPDEIIHYSPKMVDVIDLKKNSFETIRIDELLREHGDQMPMIEKMVSVCEGTHIRKPMAMSIDFAKDELLYTFEGLLSDTSFIKKVHSMLTVLEEKLGTPVDIEFAHDGSDFYLLQCRPQSASENISPAAIPKDLPEKDIIFSANKYISNGRVPDITHIVYVDPESYGSISSRSELMRVGEAVGKLNKVLPKRQFILMGPGRWGSRGDIKLGVKVTYSDINNTAVLVEIARSKGDYKPDLSFGTHFFQDLVEARIRYLPLYPDDDGIIFGERFFKSSANLLGDILPEFADLSGTLKLIDVPEATGGKVLKVLMNADLGEAVGVLSEQGGDNEEIEEIVVDAEKPTDHLWMWRLRMAEQIALQLDAERFGVSGFYVFGSTKNATAGLASDIDLIVHFSGSPEQLEELKWWLEGWSLCLDEFNYLKTGYRTGGLLDVHIVTDEDIENKTSFAVKIEAVTDAARPLEMKPSKKN